MPSRWRRKRDWFARELLIERKLLIFRWAELGKFARKPTASSPSRPCRHRAHFTLSCFWRQAPRRSVFSIGPCQIRNWRSMQMQSPKAIANGLPGSQMSPRSGPGVTVLPARWLPPRLFLCDAGEHDGLAIGKFCDRERVPPMASTVLRRVEIMRSARFSSLDTPSCRSRGASPYAPVSACGHEGQLPLPG